MRFLYFCSKLKNDYETIYIHIDFDCDMCVTITCRIEGERHKQFACRAEA